MTERELPGSLKNSVVLGRWETIAGLLPEVFHSRFQSVDLNAADTQ
jgi:hypothetical protein